MGVHKSKSIAQQCVVPTLLTGLLAIQPACAQGGGGGGSVLPSQPAAMTQNVGEPLRIIQRTVTVPHRPKAVTACVDDVKGQSFSENDENQPVGRVSRFVFGGHRPVGDPILSIFSIHPIAIEGRNDLSFNFPSLEKGFVYARIVPSAAITSKALAITAEIEELRAKLAQMKALPAPKNETLSPEAQRILKQIEMREADLENLSEPTGIRILERLSEPDEKIEPGEIAPPFTGIDSLHHEHARPLARPLAQPQPGKATFFPIMVTHWIKAGVPGTDVIFQKEDYPIPDEGSTGEILRVFLCEGKKVKIEWGPGPSQFIELTRSAPTDASRSFAELLYVGGAVTILTPPTDPASYDASKGNHNMICFQSLVAKLFNQATTLPVPTLPECP